MKRPGATRDEHKKICQACLSRFLVLRPLDCKDSARAFPKREVREKPTVILGVSTMKRSMNTDKIIISPANLFVKAYWF